MKFNRVLIAPYFGAHQKKVIFVYIVFVPTVKGYALENMFKIEILQYRFDVIIQF